MSHYAARFPDEADRLVLCSAPLFPDHRIPRTVRLLRRPLLGELLTWIWVHWAWTASFRKTWRRSAPETHRIIDSFREPFLGIVGVRRLLRLLRWGDPSVVLRRTAALLPAIRAPTLVVHGNRDPLVPRSSAVRASEAISSARIEHLEAGHFLPLESPDELSDAVLTFLHR